jgi:hypothetical protein
MEFPRDISMHICIIAQMESPPLFFFFLLYSPSYGRFYILYPFLYREYIIDRIRLLNFFFLTFPFSYVIFTPYHGLFFIMVLYLHKVCIPHMRENMCLLVF